MYRRDCLLGLAALGALAGCGAPPTLATNSPVDPVEVARLETAILAMGPGIDPAEAARAARISYEHTRQLAIEYKIVDPPLVHNTKVNMGLKPRGLCKHWAEDMEARLAEEEFQTLTLHRAIANHNKSFRIEHSTVIVSRQGDDMFSGMVIDPWRQGGILTWVLTREDADYEWWPRQEVFRYKRERQSRGAVRNLQG